MSFSYEIFFENSQKFSYENFTFSHETAILRTLEIFSEENSRDFLEITLMRILEHSLRRFQRENDYNSLERLLQEIA
jgi:hypothetical protein